jgi:predicted O-methyltransferase YrrM
MKSTDISALESVFAEFKRLDGNPGAIDESHAMLIYGLILAHKPIDILEFGLGTGVLTRVILAAIAYNERGYFVTVDNWNDFGFERPPLADELTSLGAHFITYDQQKFLESVSDNWWDMVICDANHGSEPYLIGDMIRTVRPGGILLVHDAAHDLWTRKHNGIHSDVASKHVFKAKSLLNERTDRGLLMMIKK